MLKSEARGRLCPLKMNGYTHERYLNGELNCEAHGCMAWVEWTERTDTSPSKKPTEWKPRNPPEGTCGMVPPELECGGL